MKRKSDNVEGHMMNAKKQDNYFVGKARIENKQKTIKLTQDQIRRRGDANLPQKTEKQSPSQQSKSMLDTGRNTNLNQMFYNPNELEQQKQTFSSASQQISPNKLIKSGIHPKQNESGSKLKHEQNESLMQPDSQAYLVQRGGAKKFTNNNLEQQLIEMQYQYQNVPQD